MAQRRFSNDEWVAIADFVKAELARREQAKIRKAKEALWDEVDRQIAMEPSPREIVTGTKGDWFPNTELSWQFNALEVIAADARSLKFPNTLDWYTVSADISTEYMERFSKRRGAKIEAEGANIEKFRSVAPLVDGGGLMKLNQETADILAKSTLDYYHSLYDFRGQINLLDMSAIKYGTFVARIRPVKLAKFSNEYRGVTNIVGPAVIPCDIKNTYLDDSPPALLQEGISTAPTIIRKTKQRLEDMLAGARKGGPDRGWILDQVKLIEESTDTEERKNIVDIIEAEGDLYVPRPSGKDTLILENVIVTVTESKGVARPIRFQEAPTPFRSYVSGCYMRDDMTSPYGSSPLMKGAPIQEIGTLVANSLAAVAALRGEPPIAWDRNDPNLIDTGGPEWYPGASFPTDSPNAVEILETGSLTELLQVFLGFKDHYEDLTGVNDPRRGAPARSHTTRGAAEIEASKGLARTSDFVEDQEKGPLTSMLYMEWEIIKSVLKSPQKIFIGQGGIEGWANVAAADLADRVHFKVQGSEGPLTERQRAENFVGASKFALETAAAAAQLGDKVGLRFEEMITEAYSRAGEPNPRRFISPTAELPQQSPRRPNVPGVGQQVTPVPPQAVASPRR
jgi:hypothetical protein